jgi:hypothetical protein
MGWGEAVNYFNPMLMRQGYAPMGYGPDRGMEGGPMQRPFPMRHPMQTGGNDPAYPMPGMQTGGNLPPQQLPPMHTGGPLPPMQAPGGYDSSGINPGGMYTGGPMRPMPRLARMAGNGPGFGNRLGGLIR